MKPNHLPSIAQELAVFTAEVEQFSNETGLSASTICNRGAGQTYLLETLNIRLIKMHNYMLRVRIFMADERTKRRAVASGSIGASEK